MKLTIKHCWKIIAALISVLLLCSSCYYDDFSEEHVPFDIAFSKVKEEYPDLELTEKDWEGYGWYFLKTSSTANDNSDAVIAEILHKFDNVINGTPDCMSLLNGCYISVKTDSDKWISIRYHYDVETVIKTNLDKADISTMQLLFPEINIVLYEMIDGKYVEVEY